MKKENGARAVIAWIRTSECGKYCISSCPYFCQREPDMVHACALRVNNEYDVEPLSYDEKIDGFKRSAACLAAEVKVDERMEETAAHLIAGREDDWAIVRKFAHNFLALVAKLGG